MTVQLAFDLEAAHNGACAPPARTDGRTRPCARCAALSVSPTAPPSGVRCASCRMAADRATHHCAVCAGPLDPGKKATARYCGRRCKDRADTARNAERDHANGACHEPRRCECDRPLLALDDDLAETRCLHCGRTP